MWASTLGDVFHGNGVERKSTVGAGVTTAFVWGGLNQQKLKVSRSLQV